VIEYLPRSLDVLHNLIEDYNIPLTIPGSWIQDVILRIASRFPFDP
jgi:hypothetical protein